MKRIFIIATALIILGAIIFALTACAINFDFNKLSTKTYETNTYEITEAIENILLKADTTSVNILPSEDEKCKIVCNETEHERYNVKVEEKTLNIEYVDERPWYEYIEINFESKFMDIYLPESIYNALSIELSTGNLKVANGFTFDTIGIETSTGNIDFSANANASAKINTTTGNITLKNLTAGILELKVSTGNITASDANVYGDILLRYTTADTELYDINCKNLNANGSSGNIYINNLVAEESIKIKNSTGDVKIVNSDAGKLNIETTTGNVKGRLYTEKIFIAKTSTGTIDVPKTTSGGICEIKTNTGNIKMEIIPKER